MGTEARDDGDVSGRADSASRRRIGELAAAIGNGCLVRFDPDPTTYSTVSDVVQMALTTALAVGAEIELELFNGTNVIRRIAAFDLFDANASVPPKTIIRLATQRNPDTGLNWLEVFVADDAGSEVVYTSRDTAVQRLCHVAALARRPLVFSAEGTEITSVRTGGVPA